jgi:hypothetical protein
MRGIERPLFGIRKTEQTVALCPAEGEIAGELCSPEVVDALAAYFAKRPARVAARLFLLAICLFGPAGVADAQEDFRQLIQQAGERFQPVSPEQVARARAEVTHRMQELERWVSPSSSNGQRWLRYLRWDGLKPALAPEGPLDLAALDATLRQLNRDEKGLELPQFRALAGALSRYRVLAAVTTWEKPAELYGQQLSALERQLDAYRQEPTTSNEVALGQRLGIINDLNQAPELVQAVRREFSRPNAYLDVSARLLAAGAEPISRSEQITDNILGTRIRGTAHTTGTVGISTIPSRDRAVLELISNGHSISHNVGNNGPAVIRSTAHTDFTATKRVELSDPVFAARPASANATTRSDIHSISKRGGGLGSRIVSRVGWQRARQNHARADAIASDHAEDRIVRRFNQDVNDELREARARYEEEYRRPLARRGALPEYTRFSSDTDSISIETTQANRSQLGAASPPPPAPEGFDMTMRLHESAINNYAATILAGATATESKPGQDTEFDVELPDWIRDAWQSSEMQFEEGATEDGATESEEVFKPWSMTFRDRPITVDFQDGKLTLTTHIARLKSGDQTFTNWDITGTYIPELMDGGVVLRREGDLVVLPGDFRGSLTSRQTAERRNLEKEINERSARGRGFPTTIELDALEPEGALADAGPLVFNVFATDDDWLTMAWDRQSKSGILIEPRRAQRAQRTR